MSSFFGSLSKLRSKKKTSTKEKALFASEPYASASLTSGKLLDVVALPPPVDLDEWLAANVFDFFNHLNLFYGTIAEFCTSKSCPTMSAGSNVEYLWTENVKKGVKVSAPQYIDYLMSWVQNFVDDESFFPTRAGVEFPKDFSSVVKGICKKLFRVFAHIYHSHFDKILCLNAECHFNTLFAHFYLFTQQFNLVEKKEMAPLQDLIDEMTLSGVLRDSVPRAT